MSFSNRARSFDEDLQWSVLDQDAVPDILRMARETWHVDAAFAWAALLRKAESGTIRAYRAKEPPENVDLRRLSLANVSEDFMLFVAPADETAVRSNPV